MNGKIDNKMWGIKANNMMIMSLKECFFIILPKLVVNSLFCFFLDTRDYAKILMAFPEPTHFFIWLIVSFDIARGLVVNLIKRNLFCFFFIVLNSHCFENLLLEIFWNKCEKLKVVLFILISEFQTWHRHILSSVKK